MNDRKNMINMLSPTNFEAFDKSNNFAPEQNEDESKAKEFDALLNNLILPPPINLPVQKTDETIAAPSENSSVSVVENGIEFSSKIRSVETPQDFSPQNFSLDSKKIEQNTSAEKSSLTANDAKQKVETKIDDTKIINNFPEAASLPNNSPTIAAPGKFPKKLIVKGEAQNVKLPPEIVTPPILSPHNRFTNQTVKSAASNNVSLSAFHNFLQTRGRVKNAANGETQTLETNHLHESLAALNVKIDADAPHASEKTNELSGGENFSPSMIEALPNKTNFPDALPKIFREISNLNEENSAETEKIKIDWQTNQTDLINSAAFENSSSFDANLSRRVEASKVFEQIEKPILQAVLANAETDKPQSLKLRLRPAELGAIEIKLEKTADGKIKIHFQTETENTRTILTESFDRLKDSLQNSGWQVERMEAASNSNLSLANGGEQQRENETARQNFAANQSKEQTNFGGDADASDDSGDKKSNRLLSVRA